MPNHPDRSRTAESISHLLEVIADTGDDRRLGIPPVQTGFSPLDLALDGGLMPHELVLLGGLPGAGKTICALQWARSFARQGRDVLFLTYELDQLTLLTRLLIQELAVTASQLDSTARIAMRRSVVSMMLGTTPIADVVDAYPDVEKAMTDLHSESENLRVVQASTQTTSAEEVRRLVSERVGTGGVVIVDYLQKIPVPGASSLQEQVHRATESLKEIAVVNDATVVALASVGDGAIGTRRLRLSQLRGSDSLAHECDIAMVLNEKASATSDRHLAYDLTKLADAKSRVVISVEKNRRGEHDLHLEFRKDFANFRFEPQGRFVTDALTEGEQVA